MTIFIILQHALPKTATVEYKYWERQWVVSLEKPIYLN